MEAPRPAEVTARTARVNDGLTLRLVEAHRGQGDVSGGARVPFVKAIPSFTVVLEGEADRVRTHEFVGHLNLKLPLQKPALVVDRVEISNGFLEPVCRFRSQTRVRGPFTRYRFLLNNHRAFRETR